MRDLARPNLWIYDRVADAAVPEYVLRLRQAARSGAASPPTAPAEVSVPRRAAGPADETCHFAALAFALGGIPVFPVWWALDGRCACPKGAACERPAKHPLTEHGFKDATLDPATVRGWWQRWPLANVAAPTGTASGCIALDIDPRHRGDESLGRAEAEFGALPATRTSKTGGGGRHIFMAHPGPHVRIPNKQPVRADLPGLDVRGDGGYVLLPPSGHVRGGYSWLSTASVAALPPGWARFLASPTVSHPEAAASPDSPISEGSRNGVLASLAGRLRRQGFTPREIGGLLLEVNRGRCQPPLTDGEVAGIASSVGRYVPARPLYAGPSAPRRPIVLWWTR